MSGLWQVILPLQTVLTVLLLIHHLLLLYTSSLTLGKPALYSYFAGIYTCTVTESGRLETTSGNNDNFIVTVVGKMIFTVFLDYNIINNLCRCRIIC